MDSADSSMPPVDPPQNLSGICMLDRNHVLEMACLTGHIQVSIVGDLLVVPNVTGEAISPRLVGMAVLRRIRVTLEAGEPTVRGRRICRNVDQRDPGKRLFSPRLILVCPMAVKAKPGDPLRFLRVVEGRPPVAHHAARILSGNSRQYIPIFVANAAFLLGRSGQVDVGLSGSGRQTIMWIMTGAFTDLLQYVNVTVFALL